MPESEQERAGVLRILVAEGEPRSVAVIAAACERLHLAAPELASTFDEASERTAGDDNALLFIDDELAFPLLDPATSLAPVLGVVVMGGACSGQRGFTYATRGVDAFLDTPLMEDEVITAMDRILHGPSVLDRIAASLVGRRGLKEIQDSIRRTMFSGALERAHDNRHAAARMLRINRRAVQLVAKELSDPGYNSATPPLTGLATARPAPVRGLPPGQSEIERMVDEGVAYCDQDVILWRNLPVQFAGVVERIFERIDRLSADRRSTGLVIDLTEAAYPTTAVRQRLYRGFSESTKLRHIAVFTGKNTALGIAARFVLGPHAQCPVSLHKTYASALAAAKRP